MRGSSRVRDQWNLEVRTRCAAPQIRGRYPVTSLSMRRAHVEATANVLSRAGRPNVQSEDGCDVGWAHREKMITRAEALASSG